ncbi:hypothetical protein TSAR_002215 [Trichomalopsis sarcophagae]|uniref:Uncharacterized protein n=1 Tax=Trichomalopsis sarcophagae TaxID=543379 RepID=A0A232EYH1_9HYME|nr:hypothetical protein TSAR_002215 [Trichomalopsis sarcophagae]
MCPPLRSRHVPLGCSCSYTLSAYRERPNTRDHLREKRVVVKSIVKALHRRWLLVIQMEPSGKPDTSGGLNPPEVSGFLWICTYLLLKVQSRMIYFIFEAGPLEKLRLGYYIIVELVAGKVGAVDFQRVHVCYSCCEQKEKKKCYVSHISHSRVQFSTRGKKSGKYGPRVVEQARKLNSPQAEAGVNIFTYRRQRRVRNRCYDSAGNLYFSCQDLYVSLRVKKVAVRGGSSNVKRNLIFGNVEHAKIKRNTKHLYTHAVRKFWKGSEITKTDKLTILYRLALSETQRIKK